MNVGHFRDVVTIYYDNSDDGDESPNWAPLHSNFPASVLYVNGTEGMRGRQNEAVQGYLVDLHFVSGVLPTQRVYVVHGPFSGKYLNIESVKPMQENGRTMWLRLLCQEVPSA